MVIPPDEVPEPRPAGAESDDRAVFRVDAAHRQGPRLLTFELGRNRLAIARADEQTRNELTERLAAASESLDLWEPFTRIREAIEEAQQAAR
jgi:hypothetical protein